MMEVIIVWYFLSTYGGNLAVIGPFSTEDNCKQLKTWAESKYRTTSICYQGPLAAAAITTPSAEDCHAKTGCK